ncbi:MAG: response regulator [Burkholderiales bacterium]|nr:response regulator [Burkholderiales bacterium]
MTTAGPQVLIIDDSEDDVLLASAYIRRWVRSARFRRVDSARTLSEALGEQHWDLVLCDHNMPGFDSMSALAIVREAGNAPPFFVYSGAFSRDQAQLAIQRGADGVLEKRDTPGLLRVIGRALGTGEALPA